MISKETIDSIMNTVRIDEVIGDFIALKKRGTNLLGLCPFHNEKTPSFNVSPVRGIFKCFGCGKGGNAVNFIMEHEHYSYPEALKYLARKYNISVEEDERSPEYDREQMEREALLAVSEYARKFFTRSLLESDEGRSIGLSYFTERGFTDEMISKFQLGYSPEGWRAFTDDALAAGYLQSNLEKTGLTVVSGEKMFDRFRGRVMFPIHNVAGKVIGFGGRILKTDAKTAKYLNSPESDIYHKSKVLYGLFQSRKAIAERDECFLVEGYTDVISMHQSGITNVVASSGTALTTDQIRLVRRYTKNITILYDGDPAGIKASLRGIDLILEEGMNVKVVLFPDGHDPDSFAREHSTEEIRSYVSTNANDFIRFKTSLLLKDVANDPVRRAGLIRDIVETIAKIPDGIIRSTYTRECSSLMEISEQVLITELNKILRSNIIKSAEPATETPLSELPIEEVLFNQPVVATHDQTEHQEADIIRLLLNYGDHEIFYDIQISEKESQTMTEKVMSFIVNEIVQDKISFSHAGYASIFNLFKALVHADSSYQASDFINHTDETVRSIAAHFLTVRHPLARWEDKGIFVRQEHEVNRLKHAVFSAVYSIKIKHIEKMIRNNREAIREAAESGQDIDDLLEHQKRLDEVKSRLSLYLSIVVLK